MQNIMQACIHAQPEALRQVLAGAEDTAAAMTGWYGDRPLARLILVGAGSSYHALNMARPYCQEILGVPVLAATPAQLSWLDARHAGDTLVIAASQSGTSSNTLALVQTLRGMGFPVAGITQDASSLVAGAVDCHLLLRIPEEKTGPKTMGVLGTMLTLQLAIAALGVHRGVAEAAVLPALQRDMKAITSYMPANIEAAIAWCADNSEGMRDSGSYFVVGQGDYAAIAGEGALKLVETVRVPVTAYEFEEIVHGPLLAFSGRTTLLYIGAPWQDADRPQALCDLCMAQGGRVYRLGMSLDEARNQAETLTIRTAGNPQLAGYELLVPMQVMSAYVPPMKGIDLDARKRSPQEIALAGHL